MSDRYEYRKGRLLEEDAGSDPFQLFEDWLNVARSSSAIEPSGMCLSTVSEGRPHSRIVLLRGFDRHGLVFFSNYDSDKGQNLEAHPVACCNFWWPSLERQIRVEGTVAKASKEESDAYWESRPPDSRLASAVSPQSRPIESRNQLEREIEVLRRASNGSVPRPDHWGGYRLTPDYFEFWQGGESRLHDRLAYRLSKGEWKRTRLAP